MRLVMSGGWRRMGKGRWAYLAIAAAGVWSPSVLALWSVGVPIVVGTIRISHCNEMFRSFSDCEV